MDAPDSPITDNSSPSNSALLSPPGSQGADIPSNTTPQGRGMTISSSSSGANANGKRPLNHISNGVDTAEEDAERLARAGVSSRPGSSDASATFTPQVHAKSGYTWDRPEDAPGYGWSNKKAQDEYNRAWEHVVHKQLAVKGN